MIDVKQVEESATESNNTGNEVLKEAFNEREKLLSKSNFMRDTLDYIHTKERLKEDDLELDITKEFSNTAIEKLREFHHLTEELTAALLNFANMSDPTLLDLKKCYEEVSKAYSKLVDFDL